MHAPSAVDLPLPSCASNAGLEAVSSFEFDSLARENAELKQRLEFAVQANTEQAQAKRDLQESVQEKETRLVVGENRI